MTASPSATASARVALAVAPSIVTAALAPLMVLAAPLSGVAVTVNALLADAESASRLRSNVTLRSVPFTHALEKAGGSRDSRPLIAMRAVDVPRLDHGPSSCRTRFLSAMLHLLAPSASSRSLAVNENET